MLRCGAHDRRDCLTEHISRSLPNARPGKAESGDLPKSIRSDCPVCERSDTLTVTCGEQVKFVITCHADCDRAQIRDVMVGKLGVSEDCLPPIREKRTDGKRAGRGDADMLRQLRELLDAPLNGNAFRLRAAMLLWGTDAVTAADRLGIPERTRRRLLCP